MSDEHRGWKRQMALVWGITALQIMGLVLAQDAYGLTFPLRLLIGNAILLPAAALTLYALFRRWRVGR